MDEVSEGLAEHVLDGQEERHIDRFLQAGTADGRGVAAASRRAFVEAYRGADSLRCGPAGPMSARLMGAVG